MKIRKIISLSLLAVSIMFVVSPTFAGDGDEVENVYKYRYGIDFQIKLIDNLKLELAPELRFYEGFDKFMLNGGLTYKTLGCLYWGATYRLAIGREENSSTYGNGGFYDATTAHRFAFDITYKEKYGRFTPSFRVRYSNFADDDVTNEEFMRYRAKVEYNIKKCKLSPFAIIEAYHDLNDNMLHKMRYGGGLEYKIDKQSSFSLDYKLDMFNLKYKNAHIFSLGYKVKF